MADNSTGAFPEYPKDAIVMVNGHHRQALAKQHGKGGEEIICELKRGHSREELHHIFRQVNDSRSINHAEKFMHRIGQKEQKAMEILALMEQEGFVPTTIPKAATTNAIHSTSSLEWVWDGGDAFLKKRRGKGPHRDAVAQALRAYRELVPSGQFTQQSALLKGLGAFFLRYPEADYDRLLEKLREQYPNVQKLLGASKQAKQDFHLPNNYASFGFIARLSYNGSRRVGGKNTLPEWKS